MVTAQDSDLLYAVSLAEWLPTFRKKLVRSSSTVNQLKMTALYLRKVDNHSPTDTP
jgi:hypothetical protein